MALMRPARFLTLCLWAVALAPTLTGAAIAAEPVTHSYRVEHETFGQIGYYWLTVTQDGERVVVEQRGDLRVILVGATAFREKSTSTETWQGDRLVSFDSQIESSNGDFAVSARADGDRLLVTGKEGEIVMPADTIPSQPARLATLDESRRLLFDVTRGTAIETKVVILDPETLEIGGTAYPTSHYRIIGPRGQDVWFDDAGLWIQRRLERRGALMTLTREK